MQKHDKTIASIQASHMNMPCGVAGKYWGNNQFVWQERDGLFHYWVTELLRLLTLHKFIPVQQSVHPTNNAVICKSKTKQIAVFEAL